MSGRRVASRTYALLLRAYPRRFRDRYGDDMHATLHARLSAARASGLAARLRPVWR